MRRLAGKLPENYCLPGWSNDGEFRRRRAAVREDEDDVVEPCSEPISDSLCVRVEDDKAEDMTRSGHHERAHGVECVSDIRRGERRRRTERRPAAMARGRGGP